MTTRQNKLVSKKMESALKQKLPQVLESAMLRTEAEAKEIIYLGHPEHLNAVTGTLRRSLTTETRSTSTSVIGAVGTNIKYAPIHEFGGVVERKTKKGIKRYHIPARPYLHPAWESSKKDVTDELVKGIKTIIEGCCK